MYSAGVGITKGARASAYTIGLVGMVAAASTGVASEASDTSGSPSSLISGSDSSGSGSAAVAATSVITAPANAGTATSDSSMRAASVTFITPSGEVVNLMGRAPTLTESYAPAFSRATASREARVSARVASNSKPSGVSERAVTTPRSCVISWFSISLARLTGAVSNAPRENSTCVPSETVATVSQGTAIPAMRGGLFSSPASAVMRSASASNLIIVRNLHHR